MTYKQELRKRLKEISKQMYQNGLNRTVAKIALDKYDEIHRLLATEYGQIQKLIQKLLEGD